MSPQSGLGAQGTLTIGTYVSHGFGCLLLVGMPHGMYRAEVPTCRIKPRERSSTVGALVVISHA